MPINVTVVNSVETCPTCKGAGYVVTADTPHIVKGRVAPASPLLDTLLKASKTFHHACTIEDGCVVFKLGVEWDPNTETAHEAAMAIKRVYDEQLAACGLRIIDACNDQNSLWGKIVPAA